MLDHNSQFTYLPSLSRLNVWSLHNCRSPKNRCQFTISRQVCDNWSGFVEYVWFASAGITHSSSHLHVDYLHWMKRLIGSLAALHEFLFIKEFTLRYVQVLNRWRRNRNCMNLSTGSFCPIRTIRSDLRVWSFWSMQACTLWKAEI